MSEIAKAVLDTLTPLEKEILELLIKGLNNKEISKIINVSDSTVKIYISKMMSKFCAKNRTHLAVLSLKAGFRI